MGVSIAAFGDLNLTQARAVSPVGDAPLLQDQPRRPQPQPADPQHAVSTVALAPAAMSALIEAQERLSQDAPAIVRQHTAQKIDRLIVRLEGASSPDGAPLGVRQLEVARDALSRSLVDVRA